MHTHFLNVDEVAKLQMKILFAAYSNANLVKQFYTKRNHQPPPAIT